ncbi:MAG TPA: NAD(P)H-binding protein [Puia sp.]|nr:NAD(P)H-binding protein [Puia sp.]
MVRELLLRGFQIKILIRNPENFQNIHSSIEIIQGDARDYSSVLSVTENCTAVISTLGQSKGEPPIFSDASSNIIRAMNQRNINRYIVLTGLSIDIPMDRKDLKTSQASAYMRQLFPAIIADKQKEYEILSASTVNWTLVRVPLIEQTDQKRHLSVDMEDCPGDKISATDLANFLIDQLSDQQYIRMAPFVANV